MTKPIVVFRSENAAYEFIKSILKEYEYCKKVMKKHFNKNLIMSEEEEQFQSSNICWICKRLINDHDEKVRDSSHISSSYVRIIPYFLIVIINESFAYPTNVA